MSGAGMLAAALVSTRARMLAAALVSTRARMLAPAFLLLTLCSCKGEVFFTEPSVCEHFVAAVERCRGDRFQSALVTRCEAEIKRSGPVGATIKAALSCPSTSCDELNRCLARHSHHPLATTPAERLLEHRRAALQSIKDDEYLPALTRCARAIEEIAAATGPASKGSAFVSAATTLQRFCAQEVPKWLVYLREKFLTTELDVCSPQNLERIESGTVAKPLAKGLRVACAEYHLVRELAALRRELPENLKQGEFNVKRCLNPWLNLLAQSRDEEARKVYLRVVDLCYHQLAITLLTRTKAALDQQESQLCDAKTRLIVGELRIRKLGRPVDKPLLDYFFALCPEQR